jgi:hypothetical protein
MGEVRAAAPIRSFAVRVVSAERAESVEEVRFGSDCEAAQQAQGE